MTHPAIRCRICGLRLEDKGEHVEKKEIDGRTLSFVGEEQVCSCTHKPTVNPFTSRPQPPNLNDYDRK